MSTKNNNIDNEKNPSITDSIVTKPAISERIKRKITSDGALDIELDTEYYDNPFDKSKSEVLTTQTKIHDVGDNGLVFTHGNRTLPDCPHRETGNIIIDCLNYWGIIDEAKQLPKHDAGKLFQFGFRPVSENYRRLIINIYSFFGLVDVTRAFYEGSGNFIDKVIRGVYPNLSITQNKRLETRWDIYKSKGEKKQLVHTFDYIPTKLVVTIEDEDYIIFLKSMDICAMKGAGSYASYAESSGIELPDKTLMDDYKTDMRYPLENHPQEFIKYALGDLHCRDIYRATQAQTNRVCESLNIDYIDTSLTVGSTVNKILMSYYEQKHDIPMTEKKLQELNWNLATSEYLTKQSSRTRQFLAKTDGGRCHNNKPFLANTKGSVVDIDISGCYANTMRSLSVPFGEPIILDYPKSTDGKTDIRSKLLTLGKFLDDPNLGGELSDGLWIMRISTPKDYQLKYPQDLIPSCVLPKSFETWESDCIYDGVDFGMKGNEGNFKLFTREIKHGLLNSDLLELLQFYSSPQAWKEYRNNIYIETAIYYPKSYYCESPEEYMKSINNDLGSNEVLMEKTNGKLSKITIEKHNYSWFTLDLSKLIDLLKKERAKYPKNNPKTKPLNDFYKLITNTIYGVSVSQKFPQSNVVLANNITARARTMAWCMEKGLNMFQTITDGGMFNPEKVITHGKQNITLQNLISINNPYKSKLRYTKIDGKTKDEIEKNSLLHLENLFSKLTIFQQKVFDLEIKTCEENHNEFIANGASFHGSANYLLNYPTAPKVKMRGYPDEKFYNSQGEKMPLTEEFLREILENPNKLKRAKPRLQITILKTKDYKNDYVRYKKQNIKSGESILRTKQLNEFSLTQFTFQTIEQYKSWEKTIEKLKRKNGNLNYGQSIEMFYTTSDGYLDYERMILEVYEDIQAGRMKPRCMEDKSYNLHRKKQHHPHLEERKEYMTIENPDRV